MYGKSFIRVISVGRSRLLLLYLGLRHGLFVRWVDRESQEYLDSLDFSSCGIFSRGEMMLNE